MLLLHPATLHASKRLGGSGDSLVDGVLEARLGCSAQLSDSGNTHRYLCLLILACCLMSHLWPNEVDGKHVRAGASFGLSRPPPCAPNFAEFTFPENGCIKGSGTIPPGFRA